MSLKLEEQNFFSISEACKIAGISRPNFPEDGFNKEKFPTSSTAIEMVGAFLLKMTYQD